MTKSDYTEKELLRIAIMRDILEGLVVVDHVYKLIENLYITDKQKTLLIMKYCEKVGNKNIAYELGVSERWLSSMLNEALLASYNSLKDNIRKGLVVPKEN